MLRSGGIDGCKKEGRTKIDEIPSADVVCCPSGYPRRVPDERRGTETCDVPCPPATSCMESKVSWVSVNLVGELGG